VHQHGGLSKNGGIPEVAPRTKKQKKKEDPDTLRSRAERTLAGQPPGSSAIDSSTQEKLLHELQVHQIELEMQNEALREAHLALMVSRDNYLDLYEFAPVGYLTITSKAVISEANLTIAALLGVARRDLIKDRFRKFIAPDDLGCWDRHFLAVMRSGEKLTCDLRLLKSDGSLLSARLESIRTERGHEDPVIRIAISDITAQKRAEEELIDRSRKIDATNINLIAVSEELQRNQVSLSTLLEEKEVLLSEVHHRVKNNLAAFISLLALDGTYEQTPSGQKLRKDLQNRARSMALIHDTLYKTRNFTHVNMSIYLTELCDQIAGTYHSDNIISIIIDAEGINLDLYRATPCGLIVNELVTNSFKYAFPPSFDGETVRHEPCTLRVSLTHSHGYYNLIVGDNGVGLPPDFDPLTAKSLGLKLANFIARHQLKAKIKVNTAKGTEYSIRFSEQTIVPE
jgi:PAS domain S-box-containing protein